MVDPSNDRPAGRITDLLSGDFTTAAGAYSYAIAPLAQVLVAGCPT